MCDDDVVFQFPPKRTIEGVWMPKEQYDELMAELARLRGLFGVSEPITEEMCTALTNYIPAPRAIRRCKIAGCNGRVYAAHFYCPLHQQRYERHGDPNTVLRRGRRAR